MVVLSTSKLDISMAQGPQQRHLGPVRSAQVLQMHTGPRKGMRTSQIMAENSSLGDAVAVLAVTDTDCTGHVRPGTAD